MIPRFFKDMPEKEDRKTIGDWEIIVTAIFHFKENEVYREVYKGRKIDAYIKLRILAWLKDMKTRGNYYGIGWEIRESISE